MAKLGREFKSPNSLLRAISIVLCWLLEQCLMNTLSCIIVNTLKLACRLKKDSMRIDAGNSSHKKKSILNLTEMFKEPKYVNKNDTSL